jgi:hypothetical protein
MLVEMNRAVNKMVAGYFWLIGGVAGSRRTSVSRNF